MARRQVAGALFLLFLANEILSIVQSKLNHSLRFVLCSKSQLSSNLIFMKSKAMICFILNLSL